MSLPDLLEDHFKVIRIDTESVWGSRFLKPRQPSFITQEEWNILHPQGPFEIPRNGDLTRRP